MSNELRETKHEIVIGRLDGGAIASSKNVGIAFKRPDEQFYTVRVYMFPNVTYYLSKNHGDNPNYTLFSKITRSEDGLRFQNPVGAARLSTDIKTHLEIRFNLIDRRLFMSLFPA